MITSCYPNFFVGQNNITLDEDAPLVKSNRYGNHPPVLFPSELSYLYIGGIKRFGVLSSEESSHSIYLARYSSAYKYSPRSIVMGSEEYFLYAVAYLQD